MSEVSSRACIPVVDAVAATGLASAVFLEGLAFSREDLANGVRVTWEDYAALLERATGSIGALDALPWSAGARPLEAGLLRWLSAQTVQPRILYLAGIRWYAQSLVSNVRFRCAELPDGRLRQTAEVLDPYRESSEFMATLVGVLRSVPTLVGMPKAEVEFEGNGRRGVYTIRPPRPRRGWVPLRRRPVSDDLEDLVGEAIRALSLYETERHQVQDDADRARRDLALQARQMEGFHELGRQLGHRLGLQALGDQIGQLFVRVFGMRGVSLHLAPLLGSEFDHLCTEGITDGEPTQEHVLCVADRIVGRIELWERGSAATARDRLEQLLPWLALALDNARAWAAILDQARRLESEAAEKLLAQSRLLQANKMEAVGRLARSTAHDFNNILTTINGFAEIAAQRVEEESPARAAIDQIRIAGDRGASLVHQLLSFSRRRALRNERISLNDVIRGMESMLSRLLGDNMTLKLDLEPQLCRVMADSVQMEQVLVNLVENGRDAMPAGGVLQIGTCHAPRSDRSARGSDRDARDGDRRSAGADRPPREGLEVRLWVSDEGRGMDAETRARVFEPYFTTKPAGRSHVGLGLSTVYSIVSQSGGTISIESEPGSGTLVTIDLPGEIEAEEDTVFKAVEGDGRVVLVVEDDDQVRALACQILEGVGYRVLEADGARRALEHARAAAAHVEVIVADVRLPDADGRDLGPELLGHCRSARGIIYVSGFADGDIGVYGRLPRQLDFVRKPFRRDQLLAAVQSALP